MNNETVEYLRIVPSSVNDECTQSAGLTRVGALVVIVAIVVVVDVGGVVVVLAVGGLLEDLVVLLAEKPVLAQRELVPGDELTFARAAPETFDVVDLGLGPHHEVVLAEGQPALVALGAEQPATDDADVWSRMLALPRQTTASFPAPRNFLYRCSHVSSG